MTDTVTVNIVSRCNRTKVLFSAEIDTAIPAIRAAMQTAINSDADLRGANLSYADLRGADLRGADLRDADLRGEVVLTTYPRTEQ